MRRQKQGRNTWAVGETSAIFLGGETSSEGAKRPGKGRNVQRLNVLGAECPGGETSWVRNVLSTKGLEGETTRWRNVLGAKRLEYETS